MDWINLRMWWVALTIKACKKHCWDSLKLCLDALIPTSWSCVDGSLTRVANTIMMAFLLPLSVMSLVSS